MWRLAALACLAVALHIFDGTSNAQAQNGGIDCSAFVKNPDGSWTVVQKVFIPVQNVRVREGTVFRPGGTFLGEDMAARLSKACPNQPVATPESPAAAPAPGQPIQPGQVPLSFFADANGRIDVRGLTCGQIADTSAQDAEVFLAWYGGWYNGLAKRPGINLARVRYQINNLVAYCKANREKRLSEVMELWLR